MSPPARISDRIVLAARCLPEAFHLDRKHDQKARDSNPDGRLQNGLAKLPLPQAANFLKDLYCCRSPARCALSFTPKMPGVRHVLYQKVFFLVIAIIKNQVQCAQTCCGLSFTPTAKMLMPSSLSSCAVDSDAASGPVVGLHHAQTSSVRLQTFDFIVLG